MHDWTLVRWALTSRNISGEYDSWLAKGTKEPSTKSPQLDKNSYQSRYTVHARYAAIPSPLHRRRATDGVALK